MSCESFVHAAPLPLVAGHEVPGATAGQEQELVGAWKGAEIEAGGHRD